jgi:hypothetical protein
MGYKLLGFVVWRGARWYVRKRMTRFVPSRRMTSAAIVAGAVSVAAIVAARRGD